MVNSGIIGLTYLNLPRGQPYAKYNRRVETS